LLKSVVVTGQGDIYGDAFYYWSDDDGVSHAFASGDGLQVEGGDVSSIPPYSSEHEYTFYEIVASDPVLYEYATQYTYAEGDPFSLQLITCFLGVP
jgi:hypothetical protein